MTTSLMSSNMTCLKKCQNSKVTLKYMFTVTKILSIQSMTIEKEKVIGWVMRIQT